MQSSGLGSDVLSVTSLLCDLGHILNLSGFGGRAFPPGRVQLWVISQRPRPAPLILIRTVIFGITKKKKRLPIVLKDTSDGKDASWFQSCSNGNKCAPLMD